jgi:lysophospholipase L1-like esterase
MRAVVLLTTTLVLYACGGGSSIPQGASLSTSATVANSTTRTSTTASGALTASGARVPQSWFLPNYAAIGASDAVGIGASIPCGLLHAILPGCPGGTSYAPILSREAYGPLGWLYLQDLGISEAVIGPDIRTLVNQYGSASYDTCKRRILLDVIPADFLSNELPQFPGHTNRVTIFAGANDVNGLVNALGCGAGGSTMSDQATFVTSESLAFRSDLMQLVTAVAHAAPSAKIAIANLPNLALLPFAASKSASTKFALQSFTVAFDTSINAFAGQLRVVDLLCSSASYDPRNYSSDGYHPNDAGYTLFAQLFETALSAPTPATPAACPQYTNAVQTLGLPMTEVLPNPELTADQR